MAAAGIVCAVQLLPVPVRCGHLDISHLYYDTLPSDVSHYRTTRIVLLISRTKKQAESLRPHDHRCATSTSQEVSMFVWLQ